MTEWVKGLDVAFSRVSLPWCEDRRAEGYRVFVQNLWTGGYASNDRLREVAGPNLYDAHMGGLIPAGYCNASPWFAAGVSVNEAMTNAGAMWNDLPVVACDVEIAGLTEGQIHDTILRLEIVGKRVPIYSAWWFWDGHLGNPQWPWLERHKIWPAFFDRDPDIDWDTWRYGPWGMEDIIGQQYQGTTNIEGVDVDLNVFDLDYFQDEQEEEMPELEERIKALEEKMAHEQSKHRRIELLLAWHAVMGTGIEAERFWTFIREGGVEWRLKDNGWTPPD